MAEERTCKKCGETKPLTEFRLRQFDTGLYYEGACKKCRLKKDAGDKRNKRSILDGDDDAEKSRERKREETMGGLCEDVYSLCAFGEDDTVRSTDEETAYLRLMRSMNKGGVRLEEE